MTVSFELNGKTVSVQTHPMKRMLDVLRQDCKATGTKEGCGEGECGACSVLVDGRVVNSCLIPVAQIDGTKVTTVEGINRGTASLHALQEAFLQFNGAQCGICTPGMLLASYDLLHKNNNPSDSEIREALAGNLCRCTGYMKIYDAVKHAAKVLREAR